ncbi:MAG: DOMON domain-containing protein [Sphaerochaetaceae bacterium]|nr:DOMON domain-containing protein [Sphaerochaetaceae bacterium]
MHLYRRFIFIALVLSIAIFSITAGGADEKPAVSTDKPNEVVFGENWLASWNFEDDAIRFTLVAPTIGWVGIGFNPSRMMKDADYILAYVADGEVFIRDDFGNGLTSHVSDISLGGTQTVEVIDGSEANGITTVTFRLPKSSGDAFDVVFNPGQRYKIIAAYGSNGFDNFTGMHKARKSIEVTLE